MLINSNDIKTTKEHIEVMQAFIDGKEIEFKQDLYKEIWKDCRTPIWDFINYTYRIKPLEQKRYKNFTREPYIHSDSFWENSKPIEKTHNVPFFHSIMADQFVELGIELPDYMVKQLSPEKLDYLTRKAERLRKETGYPKFEESIMEDTVVKQSEPEDRNTIELFEVMVYCDIIENFKINGTLYSNEELKQLKHYQKTGRSFIIDEDTRQIIKVINQ